MSKVNSIQRLQQLKSILEEEHRAGFVNGVATGYSVAERIFVWYASNNKLVKPYSEETLDNWSRQALDDLKAHLKN